MKLTNLIFLTLIVVLFPMALLSCSKTPEQPSTTTSLGTSTNPASVSRNSTTNFPPELDEQHLRNLNHISVLETACGHFHDAYLRMPSELSELLETGFIAFWPGNIFNSGPTIVLDGPPNPADPTHLGNVFYKRISDHDAVLVYLGLDKMKSSQDSPTLKIAERKIISPTASTFLNIDPEVNPYASLGPQMMEMSMLDRTRLAYRNMLSQSLSYIVSDAVRRNDVVEANFPDLLSKGAYYISEQGLKKLRYMAEKEDLNFIAGHFDEKHSFYHAEYVGEPVKITCIAPVYDEYMRKSLDYESPIPETEPVSVIDQDSIMEINLPEGLFITTTDI